MSIVKQQDSLCSTYSSSVSSSDETTTAKRAVYTVPVAATITGSSGSTTNNIMPLKGRTTQGSSNSNSGNSLPMKRQQQQRRQQNHDDVASTSDNHDDDDNQKRPRVALIGCCTNTRHHYFRRFVKNDHLPILLVAILIFAVISAAGISLAKVFSQHQSEEAKDTATALATENGEWFAKELDLAILPLFSMAQFATELDIFRTLPSQVSSLPFVQSNNTSNSSPTTTTKRNVTGVCDQPELVARYSSIAHAIKASAGLQGVLVNLQLAPHGVICLLHPMNNTEDFTNGTFLDNTPVWGLDLLNDANMKYYARQQIQQGKNNTLGIVGPRILAQCPTCGLYFIVRLVIHLDHNQNGHAHTHDHYYDDDEEDEADHLIWVDELGFNRWGFATALINWEQLVQRSHMHEMFQERGMSFCLTRTDRVYNDVTQTYDEQVQVLAKSDDFGTKPFQVAKELHTTNNEWVMTVEYSDNAANDWDVVVMVISVLMAFCIAFLVFVVLVQKQLHMAMLGTNMAHEAKVEIERNMTAYFAHELRNPLSAVDSALQSMPDNLPEEAVELIKGMQLCSSFMATIMNNLLDVRKMEEGKMELKCNPLSVSTLLQNVHKMLLPVVRPGVELVVICETTSASGGQNECNDWVIGDEHRLKQILYNICYNSCKYTQDGSITIYGGWDKIDNTILTCNDNNSKPRLLRLECRDTGPGIPKQEQGDLFQRFTTRGGAPGSGLGLAIAKQMVDLMSGDIYFESDPTVKPGTNCIVELPLPICDDDQVLLPDQHSDTAFHVSDNNKNDAGKKEEDLSTAPFVEPLSFLVVDDIPMNRAILKKRIQKCIAPNSTVQEASTGEQALMICCGDDNGHSLESRRQAFDVVIVDQYLEQAGGVLVGCDVVIAMRRSKLDCVIIGNSANDMDDKFIAAGADLFWKKPLPSNAVMIRQLRLALEHST